MQTLKFTSILAAEPAPSVAQATDAYAAPESISIRPFGGLNWLTRGVNDGLLAAIPSAAWRDPAAAGWTHIKGNALRDVWRAEINATAVYVKIFRHRRGGWLRRLFNADAWRAEWNGGRFAARAGIAAAAMIGLCERVRVRGKACAVLISEAIEPNYPLNQFWLTLQADTDQQRRTEDQTAVMHSLAWMLAHAHQAGFEHRDMHAENILVQPIGPRRYRTVFVDLQCARLNRAVSDAAVVRNLAQLNQWFRKNASVKDRLRFLRAYLGRRLELEGAFPHSRRLGLSFEGLVAALIAAAGRHAEHLWAQRDRRVRRTGRYFGRIRSRGWRGWAFLSSKHETAESRASGLTLAVEWWREQLRDPGALVESSSKSVAKDSHSAKVVRVSLPLPDGGTLPVIIKRPLARNWRRALRLALPPSRSKRAWTTGYALLNRDIAGARPLAYLERRLGPLILDTISVTEAITGASDLESFARNTLPNCSSHARHELKRALADLLAAQLRRLHERRFVHRDCKASNLLVLRQPGLRLVWIDMDGLRRVRQVRSVDEIAALTRLFVSLSGIPEISRSDYVRFLKGYLARFGSDLYSWRSVWRRVSKLAEQQETRRESRKVWKLEHYGRS